MVSQWVVVEDIQSLTRNMVVAVVVAEVVWAAAAVDSGVVEAGIIRLVEAISVVTRQVEEAMPVVTRRVEEVTTVVTLQVEEVVMLLLVEVTTVAPVEAAAAVTGVAVPIARLRVPVPAPVLDGEYGEGDQLSGYGVNV